LTVSEILPIRSTPGREDRTLRQLGYGTTKREEKTMATMSTIKAGDRVALKFRNGDVEEFVFLGFTHDEEPYGESGAKYTSLAVAKACLKVKTNGQLEGREKLMPYGHGVRAVFRDLVDGSEWYAYLFNGAWCYGSSADVLRFA
jgi:hypothetical protein